MNAEPLLKRILEGAGTPSEQDFVLVLDGEGLEDLPDTLKTTHDLYTVHRPRTEVGLRHTLWQAGGAPVIAVIPEDLAHRLPADLLRRARNQRVQALDVNDVLTVFLGVQVTGAEEAHIRELALTHVDDLIHALSRRTLPTVVDRTLLSELLVDVSLGDPIRGMAPEDLAASWVRSLPRWSASLHDLVCEALPRIHGDMGSLLAWGLAVKGRLEELLVYGAVLTVKDVELPRKAWGPLWDLPESLSLPVSRAVLRQTVRSLTVRTLDKLGDDAVPILERATRVAAEQLSAPVYRTSQILPIAFDTQAHEIAHRAASGRAISSDEIAWLASHRAATLHRDVLQVLEAMGRLSRFLDFDHEALVAPKAHVSRYATHGAFADLAAKQLRRAMAATHQHHAEASKVLHRYAELRNEWNREFSSALAADYKAALHQAGTPLHRVAQHVIAPVLEEGGSVYLMVLDGCSVPAFLELLYDLSQDATFPLGLRPDNEGRVTVRPGLSPLPTITSHARGALFLGQIPEDPFEAEKSWRDEQEGKTDPKRFKQNPGLQSWTRQLFLKGDLADGGRALSQALLDESVKVVAAVFNAVDDQIGSSNTGTQVRINADEIAGFRPSLRAAVRAGRKILVTADHGHSPFLGKSLRVKGKGGTRYLDASDSAPEGFIAIDTEGLGGPPGSWAYAWKMGAYRGKPQVGFHGGCGLEEVVVPLVWLEPNGLQADEPVWWHGRAVMTTEPSLTTEDLVPATPMSTTRQEAPEAKEEDKSQLGFFVRKDRLAHLSTLIDATGLSSDVSSKLSDDEQAALVLLHQNGTARVTELADALERPIGRVNGMMTLLGRKLQRAGHPRFDREVLPSGEALFRYKGTTE